MTSNFKRLVSKCHELTFSLNHWREFLRAVDKTALGNQCREIASGLRQRFAGAMVMPSPRNDEVTCYVVWRSPVNTNDESLQNNYLNFACSRRIG